MTRGVIAVPTLARHDAVGNDIRLERAALLGAGIEAHIYAERYESSPDASCLSDAAFWEAIEDPNVVLVYHLCVYWHRLEEVLDRAKCKVIVRYHNITPPAFFAAYEPLSTHATEAGLRQASQVFKSNKISLFIANSDFTRTDAEATYGPFQAPWHVVAPFVTVKDLETAPDDVATRTALEDGRMHALFVGRFVPNKGHRHLVGVASSYKELYGEDFQLTILGSVTPNFQAYKQEIDEYLAELDLTKHVAVIGGVELSVMATYYRYATAFLVMSEHEGFCVPVVEAQVLGTPVVALARTAVPETQGPDQLAWAAADYDVFAAALHAIHKDAGLRQRLAERGRANATRFMEGALNRRFVEAVRSIL